MITSDIVKTPVGTRPFVYLVDMLDRSRQWRRASTESIALFRRQLATFEAIDACSAKRSLVSRMPEQLQFPPKIFAERSCCDLLSSGVENVTSLNKRWRWIAEAQPHPLVITELI
jgi:hypothetical protein